MTHTDTHIGYLPNSRFSGLKRLMEINMSEYLFVDAAMVSDVVVCKIILTLKNIGACWRLEIGRYMTCWGAFGVDFVWMGVRGDAIRW